MAVGGPRPEELSGGRDLLDLALERGRVGRAAERRQVDMLLRVVDEVVAVAGARRLQVVVVDLPVGRRDPLHERPVEAPDLVGG
jgi:hypothetical protein